MKKIAIFPNYFFSRRDLNILTMNFMMTSRIIIFTILISYIVTKSENSSIRCDENVQISTSGNNIEKTVKSVEEICEARKKKIISGLVGLIIILCISLLLTALGQLCPWKYIICQCKSGWIGKNRLRNCFNNCCRQCCRNFCNVNPCYHSEATNPQVIRYDGRNVSVEQHI